MRRSVGLAVALAVVLTASVASAIPPWVERPIVLPEHHWSFDLGIGIERDYDPPVNPVGVGLDFEVRVSPIDRLEIGLRSGVRISDDLRNADAPYQADFYGRLYDRETFGTSNDTVANPELRVRGALLQAAVAEIALEGRVIVPVEHHTDAGVVFGVPLLFHLGHIARIDTGVWVPVLFDSPVVAEIGMPFDLWFQVTRQLWLGPMTGVTIQTNTGHADVPVGFGVGYQIVEIVDLRTEFLFPALSDAEGAQTYGFGVGIQVRLK